MAKSPCNSQNSPAVHLDLTEGAVVLATIMADKDKLKDDDQWMSPCPLTFKPFFGQTTICWVDRPREISAWVYISHAPMCSVGYQGRPLPTERTPC